MIFIFAMLLFAWIQTHRDSTPAWVYAAVLALGHAAFSIFTGGDLVGSAIVAVALFLFFWLYYFLLDYFSESVIAWWAILILGAVAVYFVPALLIITASKMIGT